MDYCLFCEKQLESPLAEHDGPSTDDASDTPVAANPTKAKAPYKHRAPLRRNQSTGKVAQKAKLTKQHAAHKESKESKESKEGNSTKGKEKAKAAVFEPWTGVYCSQACMQNDEQRSRLAIANLSTSSHPHHSQIAPRPASNSSFSTNSNSDGDLQYSSSMPARTHDTSAFFNRADHFRPPPLNLALRRASSHERGSSDSLASQNSPRQFAVMLPSRPSTRSFLRPMTPIHATFEEEDDVTPHADAQSHGRSQSHKVRHTDKEDKSEPISPTIAVSDAEPVKAKRPSPNKRRSISSTKRGLVLPSSSIASPMLSKGEEGSAIGSFTSPTLEPEWSEWQFKPSVPMHRSRTSTSSIPHLSCSPSSPASSSSSVASTAPTEAEAHAEANKHKRADSAGFLSAPSLHHYKLYSRRNQSQVAVGSAATVGKSPPRAHYHAPLSTTLNDTSIGTISAIFAARAQKRHEDELAKKRLSSSHSQPQLGDGVPWPSVHGQHHDANRLSAHQRNRSMGNIPRTGSTVSVTSLPHYFAETAAAHHLPRNVPQPVQPGTAQDEADMSSSTSTTMTAKPGGASAPKSWKWDGMPEYTLVAKSTTPSNEPVKRKRLFLFND